MKPSLLQLTSAILFSTIILTPTNGNAASKATQAESWSTVVQQFQSDTGYMTTPPTSKYALVLWNAVEKYLKKYVSPNMYPTSVTTGGYYYNVYIPSTIVVTTTTTFAGDWDGTVQVQFICDIGPNVVNPGCTSKVYNPPKIKKNQSK